MIIVYQVVPDVSDYRSFLLADRRLVLSFYFNGTPIEHWKPPEVVVDGPNKAGDFWGFNANSFSFAIDPRVLKLQPLKSMLEESGQVLPLSYRDQSFGLLNVTQRVDALSHDQTKWLVEEGSGKRILVTRFAFRPDRLPESPLFKVPESPLVFCYESGHPEREFKATVERLGLTGLLFKEVWRSE